MDVLCSPDSRFVIELCEPIQVKQLDIANFELFSSTPKDFLVSISDRYPHSVSCQHDTVSCYCRPVVASWAKKNPYVLY